MQEEYEKNVKHGGHKLDCDMAATVLNLRGGAGVERGTEQWKALRDFLNDDENLRIKVGRSMPIEPVRHPARVNLLPFSCSQHSMCSKMGTSVQHLCQHHTYHNATPHTTVSAVATNTDLVW